MGCRWSEVQILSPRPNSLLLINKLRFCLVGPGHIYWLGVAHGVANGVDLAQKTGVVMLSSADKDKLVRVLEDYFMHLMWDRLSRGEVLRSGKITDDWGEIVLQRSRDRKQLKQLSFRLAYEILVDHPNNPPSRQNSAEKRAVELAQTLIDSGEDTAVVAWKDLLPEKIK